MIKIALKYDSSNTPAITNLQRVSKPGLRKYIKPTDIRGTMNGLGISVLSTSKGVMSDKEAKLKNVGGEVLFVIF